MTAAAAAALLLAVLTPGAAFAHTELSASGPAAGELVQKPPAVLRLQFNEPVSEEFASLTVTIANRAPVTLDARVSTSAVLAKVPAQLRPSGEGPPQRWRIAYRVVSEDGHPVTGTVAFIVAAQSAPAQDPPTATATGASQPGDEAPPGTSDPGTGDAGAGGQSEGPGVSGVSAHPQTDYLPLVIAALALIGTVGSVAWLVRGRRWDQREVQEQRE